MIVPICSEPHEICAEQNTGEAVWRKTPAGDEAAVVCPAEASGKFTKVASGFFSLGTSAAACFRQAINKYALSPITGMILRRCTLDAVGLASWENPSYIKCVSKNYENIQLLVGVTNKPYFNPRCFLRHSNYWESFTSNRNS